MLLLSAAWHRTHFNTIGYRLFLAASHIDVINVIDNLYAVEGSISHLLIQKALVVML
jgi:hypothetical protein